MASMPAAAAKSQAAKVAVLVALLSVIWYSPSSLSPADTLADSADALQIPYILAWDAHQIVRNPLRLYESNAFFPYARSLAFAEHLLPEALLVAPIQWWTGNPVLAANVCAMLGLALSAFFMWLLVREWTGSASAALVAGLFYAFNTFTRTEAPRLQLLHLEWWPLALLFLSRYARDRRPRQAWGFAGSLLLQGLSCTYFLVFSVPLAPLWIAGVYAWRGRWPTAREWRALGLSLTAAALLAGVVLWPLVQNLRSMGFEKTWSAGVDVLSYVWPEGRNSLWGWLALPRRGDDTPHFLGLAGMALMLGGAIVALRDRWRRPLGGLALATALVGFALSLGPSMTIGGRPVAPAPYKLLYDHLPLLRGMASPERFAVLVRFGGALLVGFAAAALLGRARPALRPALAAGAALLVAAEHWSAPAPGFVVPTGASVPPVYAWLRAGGTEPLIELPVFPDRVKRLRASYLYFSTYHWRPIPLGRTSFYPPAHDYLAWNLRDFPDFDSVELLKRLGIRTLVVHPLLWREPRRQEHLRALDSDPRLRLVRSFPPLSESTASELGLGSERVYRILDGDPRTVAQAPLCEPGAELPRDRWSFAHSGRKLPDLVRDGDLRTAWFTREPQRPGDFFEVRLDARRRVAGLVIELSYPYDEFPRNLGLESTADGRVWDPWPFDDGLEARWQAMSELIRAPRRARLVLRVPPRDVAGARLSIARAGWDEAWPQWRIAELRLFSLCHGAPDRVVTSAAAMSAR